MLSLYGESLDKDKPKSLLYVVDEVVFSSNEKTVMVNRFLTANDPEELHQIADGISVFMYPMKPSVPSMKMPSISFPLPVEDMLLNIAQVGFRGLSLHHFLK